MLKHSLELCSLAWQLSRPKPHHHHLHVPSQVKSWVTYNMVRSLWHLQTWMYQWFAETLTANMISWRQGRFSCGRAEKQWKTQIQKNDVIGCIHGWHGHSCTGYCESSLMPWEWSPMGPNYHSYLWIWADIIISPERFLVFFKILFCSILIQMWWEFCRCLSRQHCQSNPHSPDEAD